MTATRFRVPDVCILAEDAPREKIIRTPPLLCIQVMSPGDTLRRIRERAQEYFAMGVPVCWIIDPAVRRAWTGTPAGFAQATDGILRAGDIEMPLGEVLE